MMRWSGWRAGDEGAGDGVYRDEAERVRALRYSRTREWLTLVGMIWSVALSLLALETGLSARLRRLAAGFMPARLGPAMLYASGAVLGSMAASLPLSYFGGWVVEHRYGLSNQSRRAWIVDELKGLGVSLVLVAPLAQGAYWIIRRYPARWWAILSGLTIPFSVLLGNLAPVLLLPIFNKFEPLRDRALADRLERLAEEQGVHVSDVMQMDMSRQTKKANAFFTGIGGTRRIVLGDTLLHEFTPDEVEVVLAHELGHQVHRDLWKGIGLGALLALLNFYTVSRLAPALISRSGDRWGLDREQGVADVAALPLLSLIGATVSLTLSPLVNWLIRRTVEHPADRYALDLTRNRDAFVGAMRKLGRMNLSDPQPPAIVKLMLYDHPTLKERIDFGLSYTPPGK